MNEKLDSLLEKINREGVEKAEQIAEEITSRAKKEAENKLNQANEEAGKIIKEAEKEADSSKEKGIKSLRQAYRDIVISVKKEIGEIFNRILKEKVAGALAEEELAGILREVIAKWSEEGGQETIVYLNEGTVKKIGDTILAGLQKKINDGVEVKPLRDIDAGFMVSFDGGRSRIDFTDNGVAEFIRAQVSPRLMAVLEEGSDEG